MSFVLGVLLATSVSLNIAVFLVLLSRVLCDHVLCTLQVWSPLLEIQELHRKRRWLLPHLLTEIVMVSFIVAIAIAAIATNNLIGHPFVNPTIRNDTIELTDILVSSTATYFCYKIVCGITLHATDKFVRVLFVYRVVAIICYSSFGALRESRLLVVSCTLTIIVELVIDLGKYIQNLPSCNTRLIRRKCYITTLVVLNLQISGTVSCLVYGLTRETPLNMSILSGVAFYCGLLFYTACVTWTYVYTATKLCIMSSQIQTVSPTKAFIPLFNRHNVVVKNPISVSLLLEKDFDLLRPYSNTNLYGGYEIEKNNKSQKPCTKLTSELISVLDNPKTPV